MTARHRSRLTLLLVALAAFAIMPSLAAAAKSPAKKHRHAPPPPQLALTPALSALPGVTVVMPPVGLSIEYPVLAAALGPGECPSPALTAELQRLGSPPLQLAGESQDFTVPAGAAPASPQNWEERNLYPLATQFWSRLHCLLSATDEPLTAGLNVRIGQPAWAEQIVAGATSAATNGVGFSLGNEPDLYNLPNFYSVGKPLAGEEAAAVGLYLQAAQAMRPAVGSAPLTGPELSSPSHWRASLSRVIATLGLRTVGVHAYPLSVCRTPRAATIGGLLDESVGGAPRRLAWVVAAARVAGAEPIISEANSVSCGGKAGVSDSRASAVWTVRFVLSALKTGFGEVRMHFSGDPYDPFFLRGSEVVRRPMEAAMVALNHWLPVGATLRTVPSLGKVAVTAVAAPGAQPMVLLDNEAAKASTVVLRGAVVVPTQVFSASGAVPVLRPLKGPGRRTQVSLPAGSVLAVSY